MGRPKPCTSRTRRDLLRSVARLQRGERLIVLGAGGSVGLAAVQLGALLGAEVTAVASSPEKLAVAAACGAVHRIEHRSADLRQALRRGGRFVTVGYASGGIPRIPLNLVLLKGVTILGFEFRAFAQQAGDEFHRNEAELMELLATRRASPHIGAAFELDAVAAALRLVADGGAIGKVLLDVRREG